MYLLREERRAKREIPRANALLGTIFVEYTLAKVVGIIDIRNKMLHFMGYCEGASRRDGVEGVSDLIMIGYVGGLYYHTHTPRPAVVRAGFPFRCSVLKGGFKRAKRLFPESCVTNLSDIRR